MCVCVCVCVCVFVCIHICVCSVIYNSHPLEEADSDEEVLTRLS